MKRISIFLITVILIAGMVGCGTATQYALSVLSTSGGNVTHPGMGTFVYPAGAVVILEGVPADAYSFVNWSGNVSTIADVNAPITTITMNGNYFITANFAQTTPMVSVGVCHAVGLKSDGTVVAVGIDPMETAGGLTGWGDVGNWTKITQVSAGFLYTVGLRSNGTVLATGYDVTMAGLNFTPWDVGNWTNITRVSAGFFHTVGVKSDGTVVAVGCNDSGECSVGGWTDIVQVSAGGSWSTDWGEIDAGRYFEGCTVGLKNNGTVVAVGNNSYGQCDVGNWTDIVHVAVGYGHTVGLKKNGTVVAVGDDSYGQCDVDNWTDIVQVAAGGTYTVGLKKNGTVVAVGDDSYGQCDLGNWTDIVQVAAAGGSDAASMIPAWTLGATTLGLKTDGTVVAVGTSVTWQCNVSGWDLN